MDFDGTTKKSAANRGPRLASGEPLPEGMSALPEPGEEIAGKEERRRAMFFRMVERNGWKPSNVEFGPEAAEVSFDLLLPDGSSNALALPLRRGEARNAATGETAPAASRRDAEDFVNGVLARAPKTPLATRPPAGKWASGWNSPALPGRVFATKREMDGALRGKRR